VPSKSSSLVGKLGLDALHGLGADAVRLDRAAQAASGQEVAADRGFRLRRNPRPPDVLALSLAELELASAGGAGRLVSIISRLLTHSRRYDRHSLVAGHRE
jgi:hypothetical protein